MVKSPGCQYDHLWENRLCLMIIYLFIPSDNQPGNTDFKSRTEQRMKSVLFVTTTAFQLLWISVSLASLTVPSCAKKSAAQSVFNLWKAFSYDLSTAGWDMRTSCIVQNVMFLYFFISLSKRSEIFTCSFKPQRPDIVLFCWCGCYSGVKPFLLWLPNINDYSGILNYSFSLLHISKDLFLWVVKKQDLFNGIIEYLFNVCYGI